MRCEQEVCQPLFWNCIWLYIQGRMEAVSRGDANRWGQTHARDTPSRDTPSGGWVGVQTEQRVDWRLGVSGVIDEFVHAGADVLNVAMFFESS